MKHEPKPDSDLILYQTEDGRTRIQCRFENETVWLTQAQSAGTGKQKIWLFLGCDRSPVAAVGIHARVPEVRRTPLAPTRCAPGRRAVRGHGLTNSEHPMADWGRGTFGSIGFRFSAAAPLNILGQWPPQHFPLNQRRIRSFGCWIVKSFS